MTDHWQTVAILWLLIWNLLLTLAIIAAYVTDWDELLGHSRHAPQHERMIERAKRGKSK